MREIAFDTETTGLDPKSGHRVVEIGAVEMVDRMPTGKVYHQYVNPERDMPAPAEAVHGLTEAFLSDKPLFREVGQSFRDFVGDGKLIIHNAAFDMKFINAELLWAKLPEIPHTQSFCTLIEARKRFPGAQNSLDALCRRFSVDNSRREKHGALLDAELLAEMYLELMGGAQSRMELVGAAKTESAATQNGAMPIDEANQPRIARIHQPNEAELAAHQAFLAKFDAPLWQQDV